MKRTADRGSNVASFSRLPQGLLVNYLIKTPGPLSHKELASQRRTFYTDFIVQCIMGNEHTFVDVSIYSRPSLESCVVGVLE